MEVCVEHDDRKGENVHAVPCMKHTVGLLPEIDSRECFGDPVDLLRLACVRAYRFEFTSVYGYIC